ncbi:MAG: Xaa-Pro peptidase family protein [Spirochaetaceae bacterium]|jgi:Xaa-Pro dipeptidase|nr:Xaa-Pro peptidase family protein [Spirochaetaceae bacterium]
MAARTADKKPFQERLNKAYDWMAGEGIGMAMIEDAEGRRDSSLRWLTGMPADALLFLSVERKALLVPWDINIARLYAEADYLRSYGEFDRLSVTACKKAAALLKIPHNSRIEIPSVTPYPRFLAFIEALTDFDVICRESESFNGALEQFRAVKDEEEIAVYRRAGAITDGIIDLLEKQLRGGKIKTEYDAAQLIEGECRKQGCEGTGFETLAAGPDRSFAIHAFPPYTTEPFGTRGLSILDFGVSYKGYTTDVTLTVAANITRAQGKLVTLTEKACKLALETARNGRAAADIAAGVDAFFAGANKSMPHALGHGIGLDAHESPVLRNRGDNGWILEPGMVITLEPGLYDPKLGGCRLENDILITEQGAEALTHSRIIRL